MLVQFFLSGVELIYWVAQSEYVAAAAQSASDNINTHICYTGCWEVIAYQSHQLSIFLTITAHITTMMTMSNGLVIIVIAIASLQSIESYSKVSALRNYDGRLQHLTPISSSIRSQQLRLSASTIESSLSASSSWKSVVSTNADLNEAVNEIIASASADNAENVSKYNLAIFFTSSIYEASAFKYDDFFETISKKMPGMKTIIGCTTGEKRRTSVALF